MVFAGGNRSPMTLGIRLLVNGVDPYGTERSNDRNQVPGYSYYKWELNALLTIRNAYAPFIRSHDPEDVGATQRLPGDREHEVFLGRDPSAHAASVRCHAAGHSSHPDTQLRYYEEYVREGKICSGPSLSFVCSTAFY